MERNMDSGYGMAVAEKQAAAAYDRRNIGQQLAAETRQVEIPNQIEKLERTLAGCLQGLEALGMRLEQSVMRSEPQNTAPGKEPSSVHATSLGSRLQGLTGVAAEVCARIQSMTARLEV